MKRIFNYTAHKALWDWLAEHPEKSKSEWPGWKKNGGNFLNAINNCFACETAEVLSQHRCAYCPLSWPSGLPCSKRGNLYGVWFAYHTQIILWSNKDVLEECAKLARQIRDLPIREGWEGTII